MARPPGQADLFDLVPMVKPLIGTAGPVVVREGHAEAPGPLPIEGRFRPPVNYVSDSEEP